MGFRVVSTSWLGVRAKLNAVDKALRMVLLCFSLEHARGIPAGGDGLHLGRGRALCHQQREPLVRTAAICSRGGGTVGLEEVGQKCVSPSAWEEVGGKLIQALKST